MKLIIALAITFGMLVTAGFVNAAPKGKPMGVEGTISKVSGSAFELTTKDGKTVDVTCTVNTKFQGPGSATATAADIKEGVKVSIAGGVTSAGTATTPAVYAATLVTVYGTPKKK